MIFCCFCCIYLYICICMRKCMYQCTHMSNHSWKICIFLCGGLSFGSVYLLSHAVLCRREGDDGNMPTINGRTNISTDIQTCTHTFMMWFQLVFFMGMTILGDIIQKIKFMVSNYIKEVYHKRWKCSFFDVANVFQQCFNWMWNLVMKYPPLFYGFVIYNPKIAVYCIIY